MTDIETLCNQSCADSFLCFDCNVCGDALVDDAAYCGRGLQNGNAGKQSGSNRSSESNQGFLKYTWELVI